MEQLKREFDSIIKVFASLDPEIEGPLQIQWGTKRAFEQMDAIRNKVSQEELRQMLAQERAKKPCSFCGGIMKHVQLAVNPKKTLTGHYLDSIGLIDVVFCTQCGAPIFYDSP